MTYYQDALRQANRWANPEFITPSLNAYYRVPCGHHSCFGDQAVRDAHEPGRKPMRVHGDMLAHTKPLLKSLT